MMTKGNEMKDAPVTITKTPYTQKALHERDAAIKEWQRLLAIYDATVDALTSDPMSSSRKYNECLKAYTAVNKFGFEHGILS